MRNIADTLRRNFEHMNVRFLGNSSYNTGTFMEIPLVGDRIMVPVFALPALTHTDRPDQSNPLERDALVVRMQVGCLRNPYKSLDGKLRNFLSDPYAEYAFNKLEVDHSTYYVAGGAILDKDFHPLMMLMWEFRREATEDEEHKVKFHFMRPVMQMVPEMLYKRNSMERYIANKIMPTVAVLSYISNPYTGIDWDCFMRGDSTYRGVRVIVDKFGFKVTPVSLPSISTTNEELLKVALDNLEETVR